jgi:curved DNA-binding protein CbpA
MEAVDTHYAVLNIQTDADTVTVRKAFQALALIHHPDKQGNTESFQRIQQAYSVLSCASKRKIYNDKLAKHGSGPIQENINIDLMEYDEMMGFYTACRCGGRFAVTEDELEKGLYIIECDSCSSCLCVDYQIVDE